MSALNLSDGAGVSIPGGKDLWPSSRFTQETEGKKFLSLAYGGERLEQFLYRNVLIAVTVCMEELYVASLLTLCRFLSCMSMYLQCCV